MHVSPKQKKHKRIKDLPVTARPLEKLFAYGRENLSDSELLALLLGTGTKKQNVLSLSEHLLKKYPLRTIVNLPVEKLVDFAGIGKMKAARIGAMLELGERIYAANKLTKRIIRTKEEALQELKEIVDKKQEYVIVMYLNARHELLRKETVAIGTLNAASIEPREILRFAVETPCAGFIVAHNHPSNDPAPSDDDISFTTRLQKAGEIMGILLLDHIIISSSNYFSFRDSQLKNKKKNT